MDYARSLLQTSSAALGRRAIRDDFARLISIDERPTGDGRHSDDKDSHARRDC